MAGGEVIAEGQVRVGVDTATAEAGLRKLTADFQRSMSAIDRAKAEARVTANITDVDKKIADVKRQLLELDKAEADPSVDVDTAAAEAQIKALKAQLKNLQQTKTELRVDSSQLRDANRLATISAKRQAEMSRQYERTQRVQEKAAQAAHRSAQQAVKDEAAMVRSKERARAAGRREIEQTYQNRASIDRLREAYAKLRGEETKLASKTGRPGGIFRSAGENRALASVRSELALTEHRIKSLGGSIADIDPDLERHQGLLGRWASSLSHVRVQMGFFSATLRQLGIGFIALGPIITSLGGSLVSLLGVVGTGAVGAFTVASAAVAGFSLAALGVGLVLKPAISDIKSAMTASKAYNDAVLKYGKGSEEAKTAQEKLNQTLKGVSPTARAAIKGLDQMKATWDKTTKPAQRSIFDAFGATIKTAQALLPNFAKQTNATTKTLTTGWEKWMAALRSPGAKQALDQIMGNFRASLPETMNGLQSIGTIMGHISSSASKLLPSLSHGFAGWAKQLDQSIGSGDELDQKIERVVNHMRDLGHLGQASGSALATLLSTSADSGDDLVKSLTQVIDKWNEWMKSSEGQASLKDFFAEASEESKNFFGALGNVTKLLFQLGRATAPISDGMIKILTVIGDVVSAASDLTGVNVALKLIGGSLAALWVVGKVRAFAGAVTGAARALGLLAATEAAVGASGAGGAAGGILGRLFGRGGAKAAASSADDLAMSLARSGVAAEGVAVSAGLMSSSLMLLVPPVAIAGLAYLLRDLGPVTTEFSRAQDAFRETGHLIPESIKQVVKAGNEYNASLHQQAGATQTVTQARQRLIKLQSDGAPMAKQLAAIRAVTAAEREQAVVGNQSARGRVEGVQGAKEMLKAAEARVAAGKAMVKAVHEEQRGQLDNAGDVVPWSDRSADIRDKEAKATRALAAAQKEAAGAARALAVANIPLERQVAGLAPISQDAEAGLRRLSTTIGAMATKKIGKFVDPKDVEQAAKLGNRLTKLGQGSTVKKVAVKSQGADETISKLQRVQKQSSRISGQTAKLNIKTNDTGAQQKLTRLGQLSQKVTGGKNTIRILANSSSAEQAIQRLSANLRRVAQAKYQAKIDAIDRTTAPGSSARAKLTAVAKQKYQARLEAIDNTSAGAGRAKAGADRFARGSYKAKLEADPGQALGAISSVSSQLSALDGRVAQTKIVNTTENVIVTKHKGGAAGGAASGLRTTGYATGGEPMPSSWVQQRAGERAISEPAGRSRRVQAPRYLVGEEGNHPEYVIATNPAYRESNSRYLSSAAYELGYELVPAYAQGKGKKQGQKKGKPKAGGAGPGAPPFKHQSKNHYYIKNDTFAPKAVEEYNTEMRSQEHQESLFNKELSRQEQEVSHKVRDKWDFAVLKGYLGKEIESYRQMSGPISRRIEKAVTEATTKANKSLSGPLSRGKVSSAEKEAAEISKDYSNMSAPVKHKGESEAEYHKAQKEYKTRKARKKAESKKASEYAKRLKKERENAQEVVREAQNELKELNREAPELSVKREEIETEYTNVDEIEKHPELAPYYEDPKAAKDAEKANEKPTPGEETATINQARYDLFNGFASNISGAVTPSFKSSGALAGAGAVGAGMPGLGFSSASGTTLGAIAASGHGAAASEASGGSSKVTNVTNNFAGPPPDPHTWTKQQQFELGALA